MRTKGARDAPATSRASKDIKPDRISLKPFDVDVTPFTVERVLTNIEERPKTGLRIANLNLHGLYMLLTDDSFSRFTREADLVLLDGWPVWMLAQINARRRLPLTRIGSSDWVKALLAKGSDLTICAIGGTKHTSIEAAKNIRARYDSVSWIAIDGYGFNIHSDRSLVTIDQAISKADLVLVGMGMPRQESWILQFEKQLAGKMVANVGGCIDYLAGQQMLAPRWMGRMGIEWIFRLLVNPRRLAHRYLIEPVLLLGLVARNTLRRASTHDR